MLRDIVLTEIKRGGYPLPPELVLSVIKAESGGTVGQINTKSGASGLMQVMPIALKEYNRNNKTSIPMSAMQRSDKAAAILQVRVGLWILAQYWISAYNYLSKRLPEPLNLENLAKIAQLFYVYGPGNAKPKLNKLPQPTFEAFARAYPTFPKKTIRYVNKIWRLTEEAGAIWNDSALNQWLTDHISVPTTPPLISEIEADPRKGLALAIAIVAVASFYMHKA